MDQVEIAANIAVAVAASDASRRLLTRRPARADLLAILGIGAIATGHIVRLVIDVVGSGSPEWIEPVALTVWGVLSTIALMIRPREERRSRAAERRTTLAIAVTGSLGLIWILALGEVVQTTTLSWAARVAPTASLIALAGVVSATVLALKRSGPTIPRSLVTLCSGHVLIGASVLLRSVGLVRGWDHTSFLTGASEIVGVGFVALASVGRPESEGFHPTRARVLFVHVPAMAAVVVSIGVFARSLEEVVFDLIILALIGGLVAQAIVNWSTSRRVQTVLERRVVQRTHQLEQANRLTNRIVEFVGDGIVALDSNNEVLFINPAARRLLETSDDNANGGVDADGSHGSSPLPEVFREHLATEATCFNLVLDSGDLPRTISVLAASLDPTTGSRVLALRDVTEEVTLMQMKSRVLTTVSHEIRTPLTALHGSLQLVNSGLLGELPGEVHRLLSIAHTSSERLIRLVNEFLDFERLNTVAPETGEFEPVSLAGVIDEVRRLMLPLAEQKGLFITTCCPDFTVPMVRDRIVQLLSNLVQNAVKFSPSGSTIAIEAHVADSEVQISVLDRGRGLDPRELDEIFEPFHQSESSDSRNNQGSGMGLSICRSIAARHQGRIWAENRDNGGACFHFTLPLPNAPEIALAS